MKSVRFQSSTEFLQEQKMLNFKNYDFKKFRSKKTRKKNILYLLC